MKRIFISSAMLAVSGCSAFGGNPTTETLLPSTEYETRLFVEDGLCSDTIAQPAGGSSQSFLGMFGLKAVDVVVTELFSAASKYIDRRKKELSATYAASRTHPGGTPDINTDVNTCFVLVRGDFNRRDNSPQSIQVPGLDPFYLSRNGVHSYGMVFAFEISTSATNRSDLFTQTRTPIILSLAQTAAKRRGSGKKSIVATIDLAHHSFTQKSGLKIVPSQIVFNFGELSIGTSRGGAELRRHQSVDIMASDSIGHPYKSTVTILETEDQPAIERILGEFYSENEDDIKKEFRELLGVSSE